MGCGVSKNDIAEPTRIQTVVVNVGSPESHFKAHEATLQKNRSLVCLVDTRDNGPFYDEHNIDIDNSSFHISTLPLKTNELQPLVESPQFEDDIQKEEDHDNLSQQTMFLSCEETSQIQQVVQESPLFRSTNGLVGTLASLDEILGIQEASSLKLAIKVTAEKIMSYGGVLHSLEDQVGGFFSPLECNEATTLELEHQPKEGQESLGSTIEKFDRIASPTLARSPKSILESVYKKLPPILSPPNSSLIDKISIPDPFARTPFPIHCQPRIEEIQDSLDKSQPSSPQLPHTTEMVALKNIKDIMVMDGASCGCEGSQNPTSTTLLEDLHCDVENINSLETLNVQKITNETYRSNTLQPNCHNIIVMQECDKKTGVSTINLALTSFLTCSQKMEYLEEGDIKPLSSDEFYS